MTTHKEMFVLQAESLLTAYGDQIIAQIPKDEPGVMAVFQATPEQLGFRWMNVQSLEAIAQTPSDRMHLFSSDFRKAVRNQSNPNEKILVVLNNDWTLVYICQVMVEPEKLSNSST
jgi:hypothetical protein